MRIPVELATADIMEDSLLRDRTQLDPYALDELVLSIMAEGLRHPIEVYKMSTPDEGRTYGLVSGLRRLSAMRELASRRKNGDFTTIAAFVVEPKDVPTAMSLMVSENEMRADISPWEKGLLIIRMVEEGLADTPDTAVNLLYPRLDRQRRSRLRGFAHVVDEIGDCDLTTPENLSTARMERLAAALRGGYTSLIRETLYNCRMQSLETQWEALEPVLTEAFLPEPEASDSTSDRPRRMLHLLQGLTIRRELTRTGWILRFSGPQAKKGGLIDDVMDEVERMFQRRG
jgi:ParB family transcriptional regulator, chromosome partitioning protein